jgi:hemerythrin superfamily protein
MQMRRKPKSTKKANVNDALAMLHEDHQKVDKLFKQFDKAEDEQECGQIAETVCTELEVHATLEEELFYPAVREAIEETDLIDEANVEHQTLKNLIAEIKKLLPSDPKHAAHVKVLGEYVRHHVKEEEGQIFKQVKAAKLDVEAMGQEMRARKAELTGAEVAGEEAEEE